MSNIAPIKGKITGDSNFAAIAKGLRELPDKFVVQDVKAIQKECWMTVKNAAIAKAPQDTGRLREMIIVKVGYSKRTKQVFAIVGLRKIGSKERAKIRKRKEEGKLKTFVAESDAYYGVFVEFGTRFQRSQPFMRPAFDENFRSVFTEYGAKLRARLENRVRKLERQKRRVA